MQQEVDKKAFIQSMRIINEHEKDIDLLTHEDSLYVKVGICVNEWNSSFELGISLQDKFNKRIFTIHKPIVEIMDSREKQKFLTFEFPPHFIVPGKYSWIAAIMIPGNSLIDVQWDICSFTIIDAGSAFAKHENSDYGYIFVDNYKMTIQ
jgi:hypothetical protein